LPGPSSNLLWSFGRGEETHLFAAQRVLSHRARLSRAARRGEYTEAMKKDVGAPSNIPRLTEIAA
jgi:hypothetical protein